MTLIAMSETVSRWSKELFLTEVKFISLYTTLRWVAVADRSVA